MMGKFKTRTSQKVIKDSFSVITLYQLQVFDIIVIFSGTGEKKNLNFSTRGNKNANASKNSRVIFSETYQRGFGVLG